MNMCLESEQECVGTWKPVHMAVAGASSQCQHQDSDFGPIAFIGDAGCEGIGVLQINMHVLYQSTKPRYRISWLMTVSHYSGGA